MMTPLRIEFHIETPVAGMHLPTHLDGLIAYAITQHKLNDGDYADSASIRSLAEQLPIEKHEKDGLWCWKASALIPDQTINHQMRLWTRKFDTDYYAGLIYDGMVKTGRKIEKPMKPYSIKLDTTRGLNKNHFQYIPVRMIPKFTAYCIGDKDEIEQLLQMYVTHVGAKGRLGYGRISRNEDLQNIEVFEDAAAQDLWKQRVMPWQENGYVPIQAAAIPPYWSKENTKISFVPAGLMM